MPKHLRHSSRIPIALRRSLAQQQPRENKIMSSPWHRPELVPWVEDCWILFLSLELRTKHDPRRIGYPWVWRDARRTAYAPPRDPYGKINNDHDILDDTCHMVGGCDTTVGMRDPSLQDNWWHQSRWHHVRLARIF